ncbi:unnamed protein product [Nezara viridula]|uniref:Trehalase n=1 Tax=Nezara viridula TaxID=85310 RepID=A0A9P0E8P6_NEZVI|nr:unnamed protein product [Nezara viridula]
MMQVSSKLKIVLIDISLPLSFVRRYNVDRKVIFKREMASSLSNFEESLLKLKRVYRKLEEVTVRFGEGVKYAYIKNKGKTYEKIYKKGITGWIPTDWKPEPEVVRKPLEPELQAWATHMHSLWLLLGRETAEDIALDHSIIPLPRGFIVSSPNHHEINYWDSYWIVKGLLASEMHQTAAGIIENLCHLIEKFGYVPKAGRYYFRGRSSPPLLAAMLDSYLAATQDMDFIKSKIKFVEEELKYWREKRTVVLRKENYEHVLYLYHAESVFPRVESYVDDNMMLKWIDPKEHSEYLMALNSSCESAWPISSRWCNDESISKGNLMPSNTHHIVPVDLNAYIHNAYNLLRKWFRKLGNQPKANHYKILSKDLLVSIEMVLWNEEEQVWLDYDLEHEKSRKYFHISNLAPLWSRSYSKGKVQMTKAVLEYIYSNKIDQYKGGVPVTKRQTGAPWDFPNSNPGLHALLADGLRELGTPGGKSEAVVFAQKLLRSIYTGYLDNGVVYEMYNCLDLGLPGNITNRNGIYGPTIGVTLYLLDRWYKVIRFHDECCK